MFNGQHRPVSLGLGAGTAAGLVWGLAFLLPELLRGWPPAAVVTGRYLAYGMVSAALFLTGGVTLRHTARVHWRRAVELAITGNVGYYLLVVTGIHAVGAASVTLVIGCIPVAVAVAGNMISKAYQWRRLAVPIALVATGLLIVNGLELADAHPAASASTSTKLFGLLAALGAVGSWVWYGIANARFLEAHPAISAARWSTIVATGAVTLLGLPIAIATGQLTSPTGPTSNLAHLVGVSVVLGLIISWGGTWLWNIASARLSTTVAGMLVVIETVAGLGYVYAARLQPPPLSQLLGILLVIGGVLLAVRMHNLTHSARPGTLPSNATADMDAQANGIPLTPGKMARKPYQATSVGGLIK